MFTDREALQLDDVAKRLAAMYEKRLLTGLLHEVDQLSKEGNLTAGVLGLAALSLTQLERFEEAVKAAGGALQLEPRWAWLHAALAGALAGQKQLAEAVAAQRQAVQLAPGTAAYGAGLARYLRLAGQPQEAAKTARQTLVVNPDDAETLNELGLALSASGDRAGALTHFQAAQAVAPEAAAAYLNEGLLHLESGAKTEARRALRQALQREPGMAEAENSLAETLTGRTGFLRKVALHLLTLARVTLFGWLIIAFFYYVGFRMLQLSWRAVPALLPVGQAICYATLIWLIGGFAVGHALRLAFRRGWPR